MTPLILPRYGLACLLVQQIPWNKAAWLGYETVLYKSLASQILRLIRYKNGWLFDLLGFLIIFFSVSSASTIFFIPFGFPVVFCLESVPATSLKYGQKKSCSDGAVSSLYNIQSKNIFIVSVL